MVKIGSGGANFKQGEMDEPYYILNRLPLAQGNSYVQIFYALQRHPQTGEGIRCRKLSGFQPTGLKRKIA